MIDNNPIRQEQIRKEGKIPKHLSTSKEMLTKLRTVHAFPGIVSDFRTVNRTLTDTFVNLEKNLVFSEVSNMYRATGDIDALLATGRISMEHGANLLCVPKDTRITVGGETKELSVRGLFEAPAGYELLSADYSQIELRILAHMCKDDPLLKALNGEGDVFKTIASLVNKKPAKDINDDERQAAKAICYGIIYGMGTGSLATRLSVTEEAAAEFRGQFFATFPRIQNFLDDCWNDCKNTGKIRTLTNRVRVIKNANCADSGKRSAARRTAVNSTIQGSASDLIKMAMIDIDNEISKFNACLILELHDELIFEVKKEQLNEFAVFVGTTMEAVVNKLKEPLAVQMPVNIKKGRNWSSMKPVHFKQ